MNPTTTPDYMTLLLYNSALQLNVQAIANHQTSAHLMDLSFIDKLVKMDLSESYAAQGLAASQLPRDAVGASIASGGYPPDQGGVTNTGGTVTQSNGTTTVTGGTTTVH